MDTSIIFLLGCIAGVITGIMPGVGPAHLLAILYVWMTGWNPVDLMVFYIAYITVANFIDAVPSLYFGIPGEVSAVPASRESLNLASQGLTSHTLKLCALGRLLGSALALMLSLYVVSWLLAHTEIFASHWQLCFYAFTLVCIGLAGKNLWWKNFAFMIAGLATSMIGYNYYTQQTYATGGWSDLYTGIPLLPVLIGIYVIPQLIQKTQIMHVQPLANHTAIGSHCVPSMFRGSVVGYVMGLIPGLSFILGSTAAYTLERWWQRRWSSNQHPSMAAVVASETASNTGSVSMLIPLLLFGIPIIASEAIIFDLMVDAGAFFTLGSFLKANYVTLVAWFVAACVVGTVISWPLADWFRRLSAKLLDRRFSWILFVLIMISLITEAVSQQRLMVYGLVFFLSLVIGWALRKHDVMPFVFVFVLGANLQSVLYNLIQLYS